MRLRLSHSVNKFSEITSVIAPLVIVRIIISRFRSSAFGSYGNSLGTIKPEQTLAHSIVIMYAKFYFNRLRTVEDTEYCKVGHFEKPCVIKHNKSDDSVITDNINEIAS